jgi:hypothetical protein
LLKYTPDSHPDHKTLNEALKMTQNFLDEFNMIQTKTMFPVSHIVAISLRNIVKNKNVSLGSKIPVNMGAPGRGNLISAGCCIIGKNSKNVVIKVSICLNTMPWGRMDWRRVVIFMHDSFTPKG